MEEMKDGNLYLGVTVAATSTDSIKISSIERTHGDNPIVQSVEGYRAGDQVIDLDLLVDTYIV